LGFIEGGKFLEQLC